MKKIFLLLLSFVYFMSYGQDANKRDLFFQWAKNSSKLGYLDQVFKTKQEVETDRINRDKFAKLKIYEVDKYSYQIKNGRVTDERALSEVYKYDFWGVLTFYDNVNDNFNGEYFYYKNDFLAQRQQFNKGGGFNEIDYTYSNGLLLSDKLFGGDLVSEYKYDEKKRLVSFKRSLKGLAKAKKQVYAGESFEYAYTYDDNDRLVKQKFENEFFTTITEFKYNSNNELEQEKTHHHYFSPVYNDNLEVYDVAYYEPASQYTIYKKYYYNKKNQIDSIVYDSNEKVDIPHSISYKRNIHGNVVNETVRNRWGNIIRFYKYEYGRNMTYSEMITEQVQELINEWQTKGRYESLNDYKIRVSEENRNKQAKLFMQEAINNLAKTIYKKIVPSQMEYDADNEIFKIALEGLGLIYVKVPRTEAEQFEKNQSSLFFQPQYTLSNDKISLLNCEIRNPLNNTVYSYDSKQEIAFNNLKLNLNFEDIKIDLTSQAQLEEKKVKENLQTVNLGQIDVDVNIPVNKQNNDKTFVVIIANENYQKEVPVKFAKNDGKIFKEYCVKTLGIPSQNIHITIDATFGNMKSEIKWISDVVKAYNGDAKVIFYYAGHGMPNEQTKSAYLLPVDGFSSDFETAIKLDELYKKITEYPSKSVTVFLDACFSGSQRDNGMLAEARGVKIRPKQDVLKGQTIVFSAASGDETAYPLKDKQHGLFTYYLLKKIQETNGVLTYGELFDYIKNNVNRQSIVVNQKSQTPQVNMSGEIMSTWESKTLK